MTVPTLALGGRRPLVAGSRRGALSTRSHLHHPGPRHEFRAAEPEAQAGLREHGTRGVLEEDR